MIAQTAASKQLTYSHTLTLLTTVAATEHAPLRTLLFSFQTSYLYLLLIKENEAITHHKIIKWIVIGNFLQGEIGVKDVVRDSLPT